VSGQSANEICFAYLEAAILSGRLRPGERILSEAAATELGLSRTPVRDALRSLEAAGLVTLRPNRGAVVTELGVERVAELLEMREVLEGLAARLAACRATQSGLDDMDLLVTGMKRATVDPQLWVQRHEAFHDRLAELSGRPRLAAELRRIRRLLQPAITRYAERHLEPETTGHEHELILDALRDGDSRRAESLAAAHVAANAAALLGRLPAALRSNNTVQGG
jgi:DNA-binding GntR family transcriptional regulator